MQAMFAAITCRQEARGAPLSAATLNRIWAMLRTALNAAIRHGLIGDDPASRVELPVARRPRAVVWTAARVGALAVDGGAASGGGVDGRADRRVPARDP
ncbi:hypothetical protein [Actinomadura sp. 3N508]|uniref:hypothetical protein n=1 Tax=Actinomadura sp. 3N508 TaxID=3375153 RepID=UPI00379D1725